MYLLLAVICRYVNDYYYIFHLQEIRNFGILNFQLSDIVTCGQMLNI